jgi:hypothetical protein
MAAETWSGGCQCGAVRYAFTVRPDNPCLCHCRMCQKQVAGPFAAWTGAHRADFQVTRGIIAHFQSSADALRGFCRDCGTPLTYEALSRPRMEVTIGSLDRHDEIRPVSNIGTESRASWLADIMHLPSTRTGEGDNGVGDTPERFDMIRQSNFQHPDHDTEVWTSKSNEVGQP